MIMHFMCLLRSGPSATEATSLAWECPASAGQFGSGSFFMPPLPPNPGCTYKPWRGFRRILQLLRRAGTGWTSS